MSCEGKENKEQGVRESEEREMECLVSASAEALAERIKSADADDPLLIRLAGDAEAFLRNRGFDISTPAGCKAAEQWLSSARVEDAFWEDNKPVTNAADWYLGEARLEGMMKIVRSRIGKYFGRNSCPGDEEDGDGIKA